MVSYQSKGKVTASKCIWDLSYFRLQAAQRICIMVWVWSVLHGFMALVLEPPLSELFWEMLELLWRYDLPGGSRFLWFCCIPISLFPVFHEVNTLLLYFSTVLCPHCPPSPLSSVPTVPCHHYPLSPLSSVTTVFRHHCPFVPVMKYQD